MALRFWKVHGLGNDFVVVEGPALMTPDRAVRICDRRRGIGADGVLTVLPAREGGAAYMHVYNSDGSVAAMCGNGIRCVARHLAETRGDLSYDLESFSAVARGVAEDSVAWTEIHRAFQFQFEVGRL